MTHRVNISTGSKWESIHGYARVVRVGNQVYVSGTTATAPDGSIVGIDDVYAQTRYAIEKIQAALNEAGASLADVVRTRIYLTDITRWEDASRAHVEFFGDVLPASTLVEVSKLVDPAHLVEVEVDAIIWGAPPAGV